MKVLRTLVNVARLPLREKAWVILLYPYSALVRAATLILPYKILSHYYGVRIPHDVLCPVTSHQQLMLAWRIGKVVESVTDYTPWESKCLVRAVMVRTLLYFYHVPYILYLGAKMTDEQEEPIQAHAWIKVGPRVIVGRQGHRSFSILNAFISPSLSSLLRLSTTK